MLSGYRLSKVLPQKSKTKNEKKQTNKLNVKKPKKRIILRELLSLKILNKGWYSYDVHFEKGGGWGKAKMRSYWTKGVRGEVTSNLNFFFIKEN